jgi:hypothetical protein
MKNLFSYCFILSTLILSCKQHPIRNTSDGFESKKLTNFWRSDKLIPGSFEFQSRIVKSERSALRITLNPGDQIDDEKGTILERSEIMENRKHFILENAVYEYEFSLFLPEDFPIVPTRLVIAQWKQECISDTCNPDNPIIAFRYSSGEFIITLQTAPEKIILYSHIGEIRNQWMDFKFKIRFSRQQNGFIQASLNNSQIIDYSGITAYTEDYGYPFPGHFYFKTGLYRDKMDQSMTIFIDDFKKHKIIK